MKSNIKKIIFFIVLSVLCVFAFGQTSLVGINGYIKYLNAYKNGDTLRINKTYSLSPVRIYNRLLLKNYYLPLNKGAINQVLKLGAGDSLIWVDGTAFGNWSLTGNAATDTANNFIGTTDNMPLIIKQYNVTSGIFDIMNQNVFMGGASGRNSVGKKNSFYGNTSGEVNTTGYNNVFIGYNTGSRNIDGYNNTFIGTESGQANISNYNNTFIGYRSGLVSKGNENIFIGRNSGARLDTFSQRLVINSILRGSVEEDTTLSIIYGKQGSITANQHLWFNANTHIKETAYIGDSSYVKEEADTLRIYTPKNFKIDNGSAIITDKSLLLVDSANMLKLTTDTIITDSPLVIKSNDTSYYTALGHKFNTDIYMGGYKVLTTTDTTSTLLTQSKATNTYQLKYWSKTGTAIQPYTATDTVVAPYIRLKNIHTTGTVLTEVTSTGLLDTIATTPISPIYVKKAGDTMGGSLIMNSGSILFDDYAFASGDKVAVIHESGLLDTATTVTVDNAVIGSLTISDSIRIGGLWYIGDTAIIADEDSITIPINKSMFGQIFVDSVGYMVAYANSFYVDANGTPHLVSNSSRVVATNTDTNAICLYAYAGNLILRNRSGSTLKYKIILNG